MDKLDILMNSTNGTNLWSHILTSHGRVHANSRKEALDLDIEHRAINIIKSFTPYLMSRDDG